MSGWPLWKAHTSRAHHAFVSSSPCQTPHNSRADGVTGAEGEDIGPVPALLMAATTKVYATPLVSPVTVQGDDEHEAVRPSGRLVAV